MNVEMIPPEMAPSQMTPFKNVFGQTRAKKILQGALQRGSLASSYLFFGPPGIGKFALALELARAVNCRGEGPKPCLKCSPCRRIAELKHPDVAVIFPRPKKMELEDLQQSLKKLAANPYVNLSFPENAEIHIDPIREIRSEISLRPYEGQMKVIILAEADRMNVLAANALLKTLEEPPPHTLIILTSARPGRMPSTVLSRCQQLRFASLSQHDIMSALESMSIGDPVQRQLASRLAQGNLQRAFEFLEEDLLAQRDRALKLLSTVLEANISSIVQLGQQLGKGANRSETIRLLETLQVWYRDLLIIQEGSQKDVVNADRSAQLDRMVSHYEWPDLQSALGDIDESLRAVEASVNLELVWIVLLSRLKRRCRAGSG